MPVTPELILALAALFMASTPAFAYKLTSEAVVMKGKEQSSSALGVQALGMDGACGYAVGESSQVSFSSIDAAKLVYDLADGVYLCRGNFLVEPNLNGEIQVFSIASCTKTTGEVLFTACEK